MLLGAVSCGSLQVSGQTLSNLAGVWNNVMLSTPAQLTLQRVSPNNPAVTAIPEANAFDVGTAQATAQADGTFAGDFSGNLTVVGPGLIRASVAGHEPAEFSINARHDFMFSLKRSGPAQDIELMLRAPASLAPGDLAGIWRMVSLQTPASLVVTTNSSQVVVGIQGGQSFGAQSGTLTIAADGSFSGDFGGSFTGAVSVAAGGAVTAHITIPSEPPFDRTFFVNAGKDIMAGVYREVSAQDNFEELLIFMRGPAAASVGDLKGLWRPGFFATPARLTIRQDGFGQVVEIDERNSFEFGTETLCAGHTGIFTLPQERSLGVFSLTGPGTVLANPTNAAGATRPGDGQTFSLAAGKDVLLALDTSSDLELVLATRTPALTNPAPSMGMLLLPGSNRLDVCWASDTNRFLQSSSNLVHWETLTSTGGESWSPMDPASAGTRFYRLVENPRP